MSEPKEVLIKARSIVERGWNQGDSTDGHGRFCLRAAIGLAAGSHVYNQGKYRWEELPYRATPAERWAHVERSAADVAAAALVLDQLPEPFTSISVFNDDPQTRQNDVLAVLDKAISAC